MSRYLIFRDDELVHHGVLGMHWGVRRYQNKDGSFTTAGKRRLSKGDKKAIAATTAAATTAATIRGLHTAKRTHNNRMANLHTKIATTHYVSTKNGVDIIQPEKGRFAKEYLSNKSYRKYINKRFNVNKKEQNKNIERLTRVNQMRGLDLDTAKKRATSVEMNSLADATRLSKYSNSEFIEVTSIINPRKRRLRNNVRYNFNEAEKRLECLL